VTVCPSCLLPLVEHDPSRPGMRPRAGSRSVCAYCRAFLVFVSAGPLGALGFRLADDAEAAEMRSWPAVQRLLRELDAGSHPTEAAARARGDYRRAAQDRRAAQGVIRHRVRDTWWVREPRRASSTG